MLQLRRQNASHFHLQARQIANHHRDFALTTQRQQGTLAEDIELRRERRHLHDMLHALGQHIAAERFHPALDLHIQVTADRCVVLEHMVLAVLALTGNEVQLDACRFLQHVLGDFLQIAPGIRALAIFFFDFRVVDRQQPCTGRTFDVLLQRACGNRCRDDLFRFVLCGHRHVRCDLRHAQTRQSGYTHNLRQCFVKRLATANGHHAFVYIQFNAAVFLRRGEIFGMDKGIELEFVVGDRELGAFAPDPPYALALSGELERDTFFKFGAVYRMREVDIEYGLFQRRIGRVLIELRAHDLADECRRLKFWRVASQHDLRCQYRLVERDLIFRADCPVFLGIEFELLVLVPFPLAFQRRRDGDAGRDVLAGHGQGRH